MNGPEKPMELEALPSFQQTQYAFAGHLRDPDKVAAPGDIEPRRVAIYQGLIYNNIESFLSGGFPVLRSLMADKAWHRLVRAFIRDYRCTSPYFLQISQEFLAYLQGGGAPLGEDLPFAVELAHYEWVELALDVSSQVLPDPRGVPPSPLTACYTISPLAWRLSYSFPVHKICTEFRPHDCDDAPSCLIVYRDDRDRVQFLESNPVTFRLLQLLEGGDVSGEQAVLRLAAEMEHPQPDQLFPPATDILRELIEKSIIFPPS